MGIKLSAALAAALLTPLDHTAIIKLYTLRPTCCYVHSDHLGCKAVSCGGSGCLTYAPSSRVHMLPGFSDMQLHVPSC